MNEIEISVVMSVFNEEDSLKKTIDSILTQEDVNFEFIIVNDGSTDSSSLILQRFADSDTRIKLITQANQGITKALIQGCNRANGRFIARQDAGDWSLPGRLKAQLAVLKSQADTVLCSTGTRYFSERGEALIDATLTSEEANLGLKPKFIQQLKGPSHHGSTMFNRQAYMKCGGYRSEFNVAQDLDLWTRLADFGRHTALSEIHYEAVLRKNAISSCNNKSQQLARKHIFDCIRQRKESGSDTHAVKKMSEESITQTAFQNPNTDADYYYYIGSLLLNSQTRSSRYYFLKALSARPWHMKTWVKLIQSYLS